MKALTTIFKCMILSVGAGMLAMAIVFLSAGVAAYVQTYYGSPWDVAAYFITLFACAGAVAGAIIAGTDL